MTKNKLQGENSLYLKQHAQNPVHWLAYSEEVFLQAHQANKLILFSIGYSSCHWCHVMEKQCFENPDIATMMNNNFICVKVDREERPDLDALYMEAVQIMTGRGGWPLNCFTLPDGRPIYGGTYFPPEQWKRILTSLSEGYQSNRNTYDEYAEKLFSYLSSPSLLEQKDNISPVGLKSAMDSWKQMFDAVYGGINQAPKFPMPDNYLFLLDHGLLEKDWACVDQSIKTTLAMCRGGIFDHLAGGFCRYSTDEEWKVPHFEKMLYDNAQLLGLLSSIATYTEAPDINRALQLTLDFLDKECKTPFGYLAAIDADSDGEEGTYYTWTVQELKEVCDKYFDFLASQFNIRSGQEWEHNRFVLTANNCENQDFVSPEKKINLPDELRITLLEARKKRNHPAIDSKVIASWNALALVGLCDAFAFHGKAENLTWLADILMIQVNPKGFVNRINYKGKFSQPAFFDDIAFTAFALLRTYFICGNSLYLKHSIELVRYAIEEYADNESPLFFLSGKNEKTMIRKKEIQDNVTPSSNAVMAQTLCLLGDIMANSQFTERACSMLQSVSGNFTDYLPAYSRWAKVSLMFSHPFYYFIVSGSDAIQESLAIKKYIPNSVRIHLHEDQSNIPMLSGKFLQHGNKVNICTRDACMEPFKNVSEALHYLCAEMNKSEDHLK
jgi:uncharacterized protein YyaL (SSP411 family)